MNFGQFVVFNVRVASLESSENVSNFLLWVGGRNFNFIEMNHFQTHLIFFSTITRGAPVPELKSISFFV